jgi:hypothetical protein
VSALLAFCWWEPVDARALDCVSREEVCQWVGVAKDISDVHTYLLLTQDTGQLIKRSVICLAVTSDNVNLCAEMTNSPSVKGEDLDSVSQSSPVQSTADYFVPSKNDSTEFNLSQLFFVPLGNRRWYQSQSQGH